MATSTAFDALRALNDLELGGLAADAGVSPNGAQIPVFLSDLTLPEVADGLRRRCAIFERLDGPWSSRAALVDVADLMAALGAKVRAALPKEPDDSHDARMAHAEIIDARRAIAVIHGASVASLSLVEQIRALPSIGLLARCVPPEYMVEPAPRSCDKEWVWDSCDDDWNGYGEADSREQALADAWIHWRAREKERADDREEAKDLARFEP